jgi:branched-chain amino acid transport system permease protein
MGSLILDGIIAGILTGGVYALMASGLTLIFGVMDIINIAQGAMVILGAYLSYTLEQHLHLDLFLGLFITMPVMFLFGIAIQWLFIRPLKQDRTMLSILVTYAVAIIIEGALIVFFTSNTVILHASYVTQSIYVINLYLPLIYVYGFVLSVALLAGLYFLIYRSKFGFSLRASIQNRTAAELIGVNVNQISAITFGIGVALTAAGGMVYGATTPFNPNAGYDLISRLLTIIILGGMGSLSGAMIAALGVLVVYDVTENVWSPTWSSTVVYVIMIAVLILRPQGLLGKLEGRKQ